MGQARPPTRLTVLGDIYMNNDAPGLAIDAYLAATEKPGPRRNQSPHPRRRNCSPASVNYEQAQDQ